MASDHPIPAVQASVPNSGLQPVVVTDSTKSKEAVQVPHALLKKNPIIILDQAQSITKPASPHKNIRTPPSMNSHGSHKRDIILVPDTEDTNKVKQMKVDPRPQQEFYVTNIEELKKQIEEEEAKLKVMLQLQSQKAVLTTHTPQVNTHTTTFTNATPNKIHPKPIIIHRANEPVRNIIQGGKKSYMVNPDDHKSNNIIITRPTDIDTSKHTHIETKPTIIHSAPLNKDSKFLQQHSNVDTLSPNGLEPEEFDELKQLQSKIKAITQKYSLPMPTSKHSNLFLSKHNHPKRQLSKLIERKLIKAQLPPTNRQVWPIIPFADTNFQYAVGLEEAVLYVTGEPDEFSELHKKNRIFCIACGCDFGSCWQGSKSAFYCEACDSARQMKEHRNALISHLNSLMKDVEADEREFDRYTEILLKQQTRLQQHQQQNQQQQQADTITILSQLSEGKFQIPTNAITFSNASGQRINTGTVIHQKQDNIQYVAVNTSDSTTKLQPVSFFIQTPGDKNKNGQVNPTQLHNMVYQIESKPVSSSQKK